MPEQWLEKKVTKSLLSALGKPAQTAGIAVGDVLQFREKAAVVTPVPPPPPDPPAEHHTPPPVEPPLAGVVQVARVVPNDDSAQITVAPYPGAVDYRVYPPGHPHLKKYSGGNTTVEWNGIASAGVELVVEALDRLGPYQYMDDRTPHAEMHSINGHGPSDSVPVVLARSQPFRVVPQPSPLREEALFFDDGRSGSPFVEIPHPYSPPLPPGNAHSDLFAFENDRLRALFYAAEKDESRIFEHHDHQMTVLADGPDNVNAGGVNYAAVVLVPRQAFRFTPERPVLHFSFEVDAHLTNRRWLEVGFKERSAPLVHPNVTRNSPSLHPTGEGQVGVWQIDQDGHSFQIWVPDGEPQGTPYSRLKRIESDCVRPDMVWGPDGLPHVIRQHWDKRQISARDLNRDETWLDLRQRFDLYVSRDEYLLQEAGLTIKRGRFAVPLTLEEVEFYVSQILYHTDLEHRELREHDPAELYFLQRTPWHDERHWDNIAVRALAGMPG